METTLFDINKWNNYIYNKKIELIDDIENTNNTLDTSKSSTIFNEF